MVPPQSTSVSPGSLTPFSHFEAAQVCDAGLHTPLKQSPSPSQLLPPRQCGQKPPPQSTSVSVPSLRPSSQRVPTHLPVTVEHSMLVQSSGRAQPWPVEQGAQVPPQSTSVSLPFCTPS